MTYITKWFKDTIYNNEKPIIMELRSILKRVILAIQYDIFFKEIILQ